MHANRLLGRAQCHLRRAFLVFIASAVTAGLSLQLPSGSDNRATSTALAAPLLQWLHVEGNRIVNEAGKTVILRGVNLENREWVWNSGPSINFERQAIPVAAGSPSSGGWGANIILLAVASGPVNRNNATYLSHLDELVALSKSYGAYTLLVYRYGEPNSEQATMPDQAAQDAMARLAGRYASEPSVLYGLQLEPHDVSWSSLKPRFTSMVDAIRAKNPRALIAVPGTHWGRYVHWALNDPIPRSNLVYKSHYYDPFSAFDSSYKLSQVAAKYPIIQGEFGFGSSSSLSDVRSLLDTAERLGISWGGVALPQGSLPLHAELHHGLVSQLLARRSGTGSGQPTTLLRQLLQARTRERRLPFTGSMATRCSGRTGAGIP
jgi:endoglucanase